MNIGSGKDFNFFILIIRIVGAYKACSYFPNKGFFYEADFISGLCFPIHLFIRDLVLCLKLTAQLVPNSWGAVVCCMVIWMPANEGDILRVEEFLHFLSFGEVQATWLLGI